MNNNVEEIDNAKLKRNDGRVRQYAGKEIELLWFQKKRKHAKWATANINIDALMNSKIPYGFYVNESTQLEPIVLDIFHAIGKG